MIKFTKKIIIDKPAAEIFDYTQDYQTRLTCDTFLKSAVLIDGATKADKGIWGFVKTGL